MLKNLVNIYVFRSIFIGLEPFFYLLFPRKLNADFSHVPDSYSRDMSKKIHKPPIDTEISI